MSDKLTTARLSRGQDKFEILVKPEQALDYKLGKQVTVSQLLVIEEIYSDSNKGTRASAEKLQKTFGTVSPSRIVLPLAWPVVRRLHDLGAEVRRADGDAEHAARAYNAFKSFGTLSREEWQPDGSLVAVIEMPAGLYGSFLDRVGKLTQGSIETKVLT